MEAQTGKTAQVTGATSGIGRELANLFAKDGYNLVLVTRSSGRLHQIAEEYEQQLKVVSGFIKKAHIAMSHVLPDDLIPGNARKQMEYPAESKSDQEPEANQTLLVTVLAVGFVAASTLLWAPGGMERNWRQDAEQLRRKTKQPGSRFSIPC